MHCWGDEWFEKYGNDLNCAINYCMNFWRRFGRIGSHGKEKYGRFDQYPMFWDGGLYGLIWPGCISSKGFWRTFIYWYLDMYLIKTVTKWTGIHWLFVNVWQRYIYHKALNKMIKKFPYLEKELCDPWWDIWNNKENKK